MNATTASHTLGKRLLVVTGKGGVGKSTTAGALALAAAGRGLRTIVVEVSGRCDLPGLFGVRADGPAEAELRPCLHHTTIDARSALREYLRGEVPGRAVAFVLARSHLFDTLVAVMPGMAELLTIGKAWELAQRPRHRAGSNTYDLVVLDAPASGHAGALLAAPNTFRSMAGGGPMARQSAAIDRMVRDPRATGVIVVAAPEQMAITEALELRRALHARLEISIDAVVVNRTVPSPFTPSEARKLAALNGADPAVSSALWLHERARSQRAHLARLRGDLETVPCVTLPFVFAGLGDLEPLSQLAERLARSLP